MDIENVPEKSDGTLRIISFNVRCKDDLYGSVKGRSQLIVSALRQYRPDSFGVQEATQQWLDIFERELGDEYGVVAQMRDGAEDSEASAVYYLKEKFELLDSGTMWLSETPDVFASKLPKSGCTRVATWATLKEKASGKILTIGFQPRMSENMKMIKKIVESGELGEIYYIQAGGGRRRGIPTPFGTTFIEKETGGIGAMGDIGCYSLDMLLNAVGYPKPLTATGYTSDFFGKDPAYYPNHPEYAEKFGVEDFAAGFVRLEGGIMLDFRISWAMNMDTCGDALILGKKGGLRIPSTECWNGEFNKPLTIYKTLCNETIEYQVPLKPAGNLFYDKLRSFVDSVKDGGTAPIPSSQIVINQAIIDGLVRSSKEGKEVTIEIPEV